MPVNSLTLGVLLFLVAFVFLCFVLSFVHLYSDCNTRWQRLRSWRPFRQTGEETERIRDRENEQANIEL
ncbi:unnamed protein product [Clavelina lepadiformis]|uniref:ATP synthase F0 subunit 8 n=1 Tax=Clavelina lepadiformis TaxID=159417 RepID=A0ABP0G9F5_CLALP